MTFSRWGTAVSTRKVNLRRYFLIVAILVFCAAIPSFAQQAGAENENAVWKLENAYWEYVKALDMDRYKGLWNENFVGWPYSSSQPVRKDHITDWIKAHADKGTTVAWFELKPAESQATDNIVVTTYWLTELWADKAGHGEPFTQRITHTWMKTANGWQIIGGMSSPVPAN